jgi:hypothetical protein
MSSDKGMHPSRNNWQFEAKPLEFYFMVSNGIS